jgi:hypothetical protein
MTSARAKLKPQRGYALVLVLIFMGISSMMLAGVMDWISTRARLTQRHQSYQAALAAAESAGAKTIGFMTSDYMLTDESTVAARLATYTRKVPRRSEDRDWSRFRFFDVNNNRNRVTVERLGGRQFGDIQTRYQGLRGYFTPYRVTAGAGLEAMPGVEVGAMARYDLQLASIPVFALQAYSAMDLEICPSTSIAFNGRLHANGNLYVNPSLCTVIFRNHVTAAGSIVNGKNPDDPVNRAGGLVSFQKSYDSSTKSLKLPLGTVHTPAILRALIEKPPTGEKASSLIGKQRFYNLADLVITVNDSGTRATSGASDNFSVAVPLTRINPFLSTNHVFYDKRESRQVQTVELDVGAFIAQMPGLKSVLGREVKTIYVAGLRSTAPDAINGVRLVNGATLPATGLTVATVNPLYVQGHYNVYASHVGTTNTTMTCPAALVADAVNLLSSSWQDANSDKPLSSRVATGTTVNAGVIAGVVPTGGGFYSGGFENILRLLENWSGVMLTFNGSLAVFYTSQIAASPWGALDDVYSPPRRNFSWDGNVQEETKIPPNTPQLRTVFYGQYTVLPGLAP